MFLSQWERRTTGRQEKHVTVEERFERIEKNLDTLIKIHLDNDREYGERLDRLATDIAELKEVSRQDGEHIRALARIAEIHERRINNLEDEAE
jgi:hypothetical protein